MRALDFEHSKYLTDTDSEAPVVSAGTCHSSCCGAAWGVVHFRRSWLIRPQICLADLPEDLSGTYRTNDYYLWEWCIFDNCRNSTQVLHVLQPQTWLTCQRRDPTVIDPLVKNMRYVTHVHHRFQNRLFDINSYEGIGTFLRQHSGPLEFHVRQLFDITILDLSKDSHKFNVSRRRC